MCRKPKTKVITPVNHRGHTLDNTMNQSKFKAKREMYERIMITFDFTSDWTKSNAIFFGADVRSNNKNIFFFDNKIKTAPSLLHFK